MCVCVFVFFSRTGSSGSQRCEASRFSGHQPVLFVISICPWRTGDPGAKHRGLRVQSLFAAGRLRGWSLDFHLGWVLKNFMPFHGYIYWASPGNADTEDWPCDWRGWVLGKWGSWWCFFFPQLDWKVVAIRSSYPFNSHLLCLGWSEFTTRR